ncbi:TPA: hypothetical protein ACSCX2_004032 [Aeromonas veronii]
MGCIKRGQNHEFERGFICFEGCVMFVFGIAVSTSISFMGVLLGVLVLLGIQKFILNQWFGVEIR